MEENNALERLQDDRKLWKYILLGIATLGIYDLYLIYTMVQDIDIACSFVEETEEETVNPLHVVLFSVLTIGIYWIYWCYKQGNRMQKAGENYRLNIEESGKTYLLWNLFGGLLAGVGIWIAFFLLISNTNDLCKAYNMARSLEEKQRINEKTSEKLPGGAQGMIRCLSGEYQNANIQIKEDKPLVIGRKTQTCNLIISSQYADVSREHCTIRLFEGYYYVTDHSTYGTFINDSKERMESGTEQKLAPGTKISLGHGDNSFLLS